MFLETLCMSVMSQFVELLNKDYIFFNSSEVSCGNAYLW